MYSSEQIANKFIELALSIGKPITPMQAQKLTYIAHGISLGHRGIGLLNEPVCAWRYGPVMPSLYHALKHNGSSEIKQTLPSIASFVPTPDLDGFTDQVVRAVYNTYGRYSGEVLSEFTHRAGTPWSQTYRSGKTIIDDSIIHNYYQRLITKDPTCIGL